jgi:urease accessory protein
VIELADTAAHARPAAASPGRGEIVVSRAGRRSVVRKAYATSPLKLLTPANHGHAAWIYTSSYGGGLVDGDRIAVDVEVGAGAAAFVSTQASTKIYRSPGGTRARLRARVEPHGLLVLAPDPVVCFAASRYAQEQSIDLAAGAGLVLIDALSSGRRAAGERWAFAEYRGQIDVRYGSRLLVHDVLALRAGDGDLAARLGRFDVLAVAVLAGPALCAQAAAIVATVGAAPVERRAEQLVTATALGDVGCVLRLAGRSVEDVSRTMRRLLSFVPEMLGDDPWRRKW